VYAQSSAINFIRNVKTPTFEYGGCVELGKHVSLFLVLARRLLFLPV